jgi:hypothetical protein
LTAVEFDIADDQRITPRCRATHVIKPGSNGVEPKATIRPVSVTDLNNSDTYLSVSYLDDQLLIPIVETIVFLGCDIFAEGGDTLYFQYAESYFEQGAFVPGVSQQREPLLAATPDGLNNIFTVPNGSEALVLCAERWRQKKTIK